MTGNTIHNRRDEPLSGADKIIQVLADEGVNTLFGYSGGAILPVFDAIFRFNKDFPLENGNESMPLIVPANEQGAGFMASGYARASGKPGVIVVTSGPGATNCVTPIRDAAADSIPMIMICGQVASASIGTDAFQEAPVSALMGTVAKHVFLVTDPEKLEATVRTAFLIATSGRPGPVVIDVPKDIQNHISPFKGKGLLDIKGYIHRMEQVNFNTVTDQHCIEFFELLRQSKKPLIYAGGGSISANVGAELTEFSERHSVPIVTTLMGIGTIDTEHANCLNMLGMHGTAYANYAVDDCDLLITIGARFDDRVAGKPKDFAPSAKKILQFDIDPSEINKVKPVNWSFIGNIKDAFQIILNYSKTLEISYKAEEWLNHNIKNKEVYALNFNRNSELIQPYSVIEKINKITKGNACISTGVGQHQMWAAQYAHFSRPRLWLTSGSMGTMGFGLPAAIGAQFANREQLVIDIDGDASIRMNIGEMETVTSYHLPIKVLVLNNYGDGMVMQWQRMFYESRMSASDKSLRKKDFVQAALADGFEFAQRVSDPKELDHHLKSFLSFEGPAFLEVVIDQEAGVYPMVPPGMSYENMITGDYIPNRYSKKTKAKVDASEMF
jgi:acetolactate synthase I/II/III large subunit